MSFTVPIASGWVPKLPVQLVRVFRAPGAGANDSVEIFNMQQAVLSCFRQAVRHHVVRDDPRNTLDSTLEEVVTQHNYV